MSETKMPQTVIMETMSDGEYPLVNDHILVYKEIRLMHNAMEDMPAFMTKRIL